MSKKSLLSSNRRAQIVIWRDEGYSEREVRVKIGCSKRTVHIAIVNFQNSRIFSDKDRSGHPRKTSSGNDHSIKRMLHDSQQVLLRRYVLYRCKTVQMSVLRRIHVVCNFSLVWNHPNQLINNGELQLWNPNVWQHDTRTVEDWSEVVFSWI